MSLSRHSPSGVDCPGGVGRDGDAADGVKDGARDGRDLARLGEEEIDVNLPGQGFAAVEVEIVRVEIEVSVSVETQADSIRKS